MCLDYVQAHASCDPPNSRSKTPSLLIQHNLYVQIGLFSWNFKGREELVCLSKCLTYPDNYF